jgi:hypothetical protein
MYKYAIHPRAATFCKPLKLRVLTFESVCDMKEAACATSKFGFACDFN